MGGLAGATIGGALGACIGSALPGLGTVLGALFGTIAGGFIGSYTFKAMLRMVEEKMKNLSRTHPPPPRLSVFMQSIELVIIFHNFFLYHLAI